MQYTPIQRIPSNDEIIARFPLSTKAEEQVKRDQEEVKNILSGKDDRLLVIMGPCSAWPFDATLEYAHRLVPLAKELSSKLKIVMRVYIQKPRTTKGWTGPVNQPDPYEKPDIAAGAFYCRELMVNVIEAGLPIADEALFTSNAKGFLELLSWVAIGARSTEDQEHRIFASMVDCAVGMKNPTSGSLEIGVNGIIAAQHQHHTVFEGQQIETLGNPYAHLVLRGGMDRPNYYTEDILLALELLHKNKIKNPAIVVDTSHDNCRLPTGKDPLLQGKVVREVVSQMQLFPEIKAGVKGFMFESFLKTGAQKAESFSPEDIDRGGLSITDPCMGWEETEELLRWLSETV
ncbi:MAG: 3-deoxy-7-phosphoheptulonate synthase [Candidatus Peregrinibacteria bacterium]